MGDIPLSVWLGALAVASAIPLLWWTLSSARENPGVRTRLATPDSSNLREISLARPASERLVRPGLSSLGRVGRWLTPAGTVERLEDKITSAGLAATWPVERVLAVKVLAGGGLGLVGFLRWASAPTRVDLLILAVAMVTAGFMIPDLLFNGRARARMNEISNDLPDVLDQITISVEAGLGFEAALGHVAEGIDGPIGEELRRTLHDIRLGMTREQAFGNLVKRADVDELRHFVLALQQAEKLGVPIADVLRVQASELRVIRRQKAEENAQKLPVKMIFPLILCILPALVIVLLAPAVFDFFDLFPTGGSS